MNIKARIVHAVQRTLGNLSFIRIIEWNNMLKLLKPQIGDKILDIACGEGELSLKILRKKCEVHGIDISVDSVRRGHLLNLSYDGSHFLVADAECLPYKGGYFDKIICSSSLEHFYNDLMALEEMNRVLNESGIIVLSIDSLSYPLPENIKEKHRQQYHVVRYYKLEDISELLDRTGFKMLSFKYLFTSPLASFLYNLSIFTQGKYYGHLLVLLLGDMLIPLLVASDRLIGKKNCGYTLLIEAEKK